MARPSALSGIRTPSTSVGIARVALIAVSILLMLQPTGSLSEGLPEPGSGGWGRPAPAQRVCRFGARKRNEASAAEAAKHPRNPACWSFGQSAYPNRKGDQRHV